MSGISILSYLILALVIGYSFIYPAVADMNALTEEKQNYEETLAKVRDIETTKNELLAKYNDIPDEQKTAINTLLPSSLNFTKLISQMEAAAAKNGISIKRVDSKETSNSSAAVNDSSSDKIYKSATISLSFEATYEKFNSFMQDLEKSMRILDIRTIKLSVPQNKNVYSYDVEFETYWLK